MYKCTNVLMIKLKKTLYNVFFLGVWIISGLSKEYHNVIMKLKHFFITQGSDWGCVCKMASKTETNKNNWN